jgi:phosphoribosyl 1,2-cyclic phosphodiesterase
MKLTFLGTRANIDAKSRRHRRHSAMAIAHKGTRVIIDCGADWLGAVATWKTDAIFLTHAHPDHAWGLKGGAPCPVHATREAWESLAGFPITERQTVRPGKTDKIGGVTLQAFPVVHSLRAPAVGYRVCAGRSKLFYVPDVVAIEERHEALCGIDLYVGDGSSLIRSLVRRRGDELFGHTTIRAQLGWCEQEGVKRAVFTHCGRQVVEGDERTLRPKLASLAADHGVEARFAYDGMEVMLR